MRLRIKMNRILLVSCRYSLSLSRGDPAFLLGSSCDARGYYRAALHIDYSGGLQQYKKSRRA